MEACQSLTERDMSLTIDLPLEIESCLRERAAGSGMAPEALVRELVESGLAVPTLERDLARFHDAVIASGESEEESAAFFQSVVDTVRSERAGK